LHGVEPKRLTSLTRADPQRGQDDGAPDENAPAQLAAAGGAIP
jgi:hypothetical protein